MNIVAENMKRIIDERGYKMKAIADKTGMNDTKFYNLINGKVIIRADMIPGFCKALDVQPNDLFRELEDAQ